MGSTVRLTATVNGSSPTGKVTWSTSGSGKFSAHTCKLSKGSCSVKYTPTSASQSVVLIIGSYLGNKHNPSSLGVLSLSVTQKATTATLSCSSSSLKSGSSKAVKCTVHVKGYHPTGTVTWSQSGAGSVTLSSDTCVLVKGTCSIKMTGATAGTVTIQAAYAGDANNEETTSPSKTLLVRVGTSTVTSSSTTVSSTTATTSNDCGSAAICTNTTSTSTTGPSAVGTTTTSSTTASNTTSTTANLATIVVAVDFQGNPANAQQVTVFIDGASVGFAENGYPLVYTVSPGSHTVACSNVTGYLPLTAATFTISANQAALVECVYTPIASGATATTTTATATTSSATNTASSATSTSTSLSTSWTTSITTTSITASSISGTTMPNPSFQNGTVDIWYPPNSSALVNYALGLINNDREANGLPPLSLSVVPSGQQHADSMDYFNYFSHTDPQGYDPYQRYTMLGGSGSMGENIGLAYCTNSPPDSTELTVLPCSLTTVENAVAVLEWNMMNNDVQCCNNGHRDNILNPLFTTVSIGIAYNSTTGAVYFVEDFGDV